MGINEKDPPTYRVSSAQDREQIIAEVVAHAALQEAQYRQPMADPRKPGGWKIALAVALLVVAGGAAAFPPAWLAGSTPRLTDDDRVRGLMATMHIQAQQLDAFRARTGRLPNSLDELEHTAPEVHYVRSSHRVYQLVVTAPDGRNLVYDSGRPAEDFAAVASGWLPERDGS